MVDDHTTRFTFETAVVTSDGLKEFLLEFGGSQRWTHDTIEGAYHPDQKNAVYGWYADDSPSVEEFTVDGISHNPDEWRSVLEQLSVPKAEIDRIDNELVLAIDAKADHDR